MVFQIDSDDEMSHIYFEAFWNNRQKYSALFGNRIGRQQNIGRSIISKVSRVAVRLFFGRGVTDVNVPYRLMRSSVLSKIVGKIPSDTFAPNILISGVISVSGLPILNVPVPHESRKSGASSIVKSRLWKAAVLSLVQTIRFGIRNICNNAR